MSSLKEGRARPHPHGERGVEHHAYVATTSKHYTGVDSTDSLRSHSCVVLSRLCSVVGC